MDSRGHTDERHQVPPADLAGPQIVRPSIEGQSVRRPNTPPRSGGTGASPFLPRPTAGTKDRSQVPLTGSAAATPQPARPGAGRESSSLRAKDQQPAGSTDNPKPSCSPSKHRETRLQPPPLGSAGPQTIPQGKGKESSTLKGNMQQPENIRTVPLSPLGLVPVSPFAAGSSRLPTVQTATPGGESSTARTETRDKKESPSRMQTQPARERKQGRLLGSATRDSTTSKETTHSIGARSTQIRPLSERGQEQASGASQGQALGTGQEQHSGTSQLRWAPVTPNLPPGLETSTAGPSASPPGSVIRTIKVGIETEFYLAANNPEYFQETMPNFSVMLAEIYNEKVPRQHPRMRPNMRPYEFHGDYNRWCLVNDETVSTQRSPWGIELVSPVFRVFRGSNWRRDVEAMWGFLQKHYDIMGSGSCATHIHVQIAPNFTLTDIKRIAQAAIHFEPSFEALMPPLRRGNPYAKSNWLEGPRLGRAGLSRQESIAAIERVSDFHRLMELMQPLQPNTDRSLAWNFYSLFTSTGTIEFRKPPVSLTPEENLSWAELALSFVHAAVRCEASKMQKVPSNIGGLHWFLQQFNVPGMNEPARLQSLFRGKNPAAALEPSPQPQGDMEERMRLEAKLRKTIALDQLQIQAFAKTAREPYW